MHYIKINQKNLRTDLILEQKNNIREESKYQENNIIVTNSRDNNYNYTTIYYKDITDKDVSSKKDVLELKKTKRITVTNGGWSISSRISFGPRKS